MSPIRSLLVLLVFLATSLPAAEFKVTVKGGEKTAKHVPIRIPVPDNIESDYVSLSGGGNYLLGQISDSRLMGSSKRELSFVMPVLEANEEIKMQGKSIAEEEATNAFKIVEDSNKHTRDIRQADRSILRCMFEPIDRSSEERIGETYKVYHHVFDPTGSFFMTKGPGGKFAHHRGLFFGFNRISYGDKKADIWHCRKGEHQHHRELLQSVTGPALGREQALIAWHGQDDKVFAEEKRELTAYNVEGGLLIEFATLLESKVGKVRLDGDPQHAGFQFRASQLVPDKTIDKTYYVRPDGKGEPGQFRNWSNKDNESKQNLAHIDLAWNALCFVIDDQRYTCCYLDHPNNPKPARFSERDYGRFGSYFEYDLDTDKPLKLNYRIWLQSGEMTVEQVDEISRGFVSTPTASVEFK